MPNLPQNSNHKIATKRSIENQLWSLLWDLVTLKGRTSLVLQIDWKNLNQDKTTETPLLQVQLHQTSNEPSPGCTTNCIDLSLGHWLHQRILHWGLILMDSNNLRKQHQKQNWQGNSIINNVKANLPKIQVETYLLSRENQAQWGRTVTQQHQ